jgi:peptide/nickel transport system substrate-binding protein
MEHKAVRSQSAWRTRRTAAISVVGAVAAATGLIGQGALPASAQPKSGGSITMVELGIEANIDPAIGGISAYPYAPAMEAVFGPGLAYITPAGKVVMGFAKSMTPSNDLKTWTITLHPGLKFSDGTAFNAAAVANNINRDKDPTIGSTYQKIAETMKTTVENATTLKVTLQTPNSQFPALIAADFGAIGSPTAIKNEGQNFGTKPVGAGPFILKNTVLNTSQSFSKNPNFYIKGQPYINTLNLQSLPSYTQQVNALQTGSAQVSWASNGQVFEQFKKAGIHVDAFPLQGPFFLAFNNAAAPFNNIKAREAVYYALNRVGASNAWGPGNPVSETFFSKSSPLYNPVKWPGQDTQKAQQLFNQLASAGHPVDFTFMLPQGYPTLAPYIQADLSSFKNVKVAVKTELVSGYVTDLQKGTYQMTAYGISAPSEEPFLTGLYQSNGPGNYERWVDPKVDAALKNYLATTNVSQQKQDWQTVSTEITKQFPFIPTFQGETSLNWDTAKLGGVNPVWYGEVPMWNEIYLKG